MYYLEIILFCIVIITCIKLKIKNNFLKVNNLSNMETIKKTINLIKEKQLIILDKMVLNQTLNVDLTTEIKQLSNEVLELHQDFIKQYAR